MFSERVLFGTLDAIGEGMNKKMLPKGSKKVSIRHHFEARVDFWKQWFYYSKTMIFEVLEVLGDDLETFPGMKAAKRALERCLRVPFCRFDEIFEILRVPVGGHFRWKNWTFFWFDFWSNFEVKMGGAGGRGGTPLKPQEPENLRNCISGIGTPFTPCGVGADPKASPLPPAPLVIATWGERRIWRYAGFATIQFGWPLRLLTCKPSTSRCILKQNYPWQFRGRPQN